MTKANKLASAVRLALFTGMASLTTTTAFAQESQSVEVTNTQSEDVLVEDTLAEDSLEEGAERIQVTGSRIRRSEFSNASPVQVISGDISREMGLFDAGQML
ncbi:MAG: hypothetical protein HWE26_10650, partial [Alteromonadaceae bacterium]|nr:hypothetical protein [Alteromonadaceae bacterium]